MAVPISTFAQQMNADALRLRLLAAEQGEFDFLMPFSERRSLLNAKEVALCIGREVDFVYSLIEDAQLEAHGIPDRKRTEYRITRRSVLLYLARTANYEPKYHLDRMLKCVDAMTPAEFEALIKHATKRRARL